MVEASSSAFDVRTDRQQLTTVAYGTGDLLADRQQIYRYMQPPQEPITDWLYGLVGGASAVTDPVVDIGTGNGQYLLSLPDRCRVGLDLSSGMLNSARLAGLDAPLVVADAQALPLADNSAGTLLTNHMLYHVPHIVVAVREARRVLTPGGVLLAATNGPDHLAEMFTVFDKAVEQLAGNEFHLDRSGERFTLENGAEILRSTFASVESHHRRELVVPDVAPVMRYLASTIGLAPTLPNNVEFTDVLAIAEPLVHAVINRRGAFRVAVHAGAFVCR